MLNRVLEKIGGNLHGKIGHLLCVVIFFVFMIFASLFFVLKLPITLCFKGETSKSLRILSIISRIFLDYFINIFKGAKSPKCIGCGTTEFLDKKGYNVSWGKLDRKTGRAVCTNCKTIVDFIE